VTSGLAAGDLVLLGSAVQDGQRVRTNVQTWKPGQLQPAGSAQDAGSALSNAMGR
jgi:hypothetical protein